MCAAVGLAVQGCSADDELPRQSVSGLIRLDGQPLAQGNCSFLPARLGRGSSGSHGGCHDPERPVFDSAGIRTDSWEVHGRGFRR